MNKKILNILVGVFVGAGCSILFDITKVSNSKNITPATKTSSQLNQSFSGIAKVIDGDSIRVDKNEVRLYGIDAPEYKQTCFNAKKTEYFCGQASRKFLSNLASNKEVICYYEKKDMYNRFLARCFIGETSINDEILKNGMAIIYDYKNANQNMIDLETAAKANKIGIWQGAFQLPKEYRKLSAANKENITKSKNN